MLGPGQRLLVAAELGMCIAHQKRWRPCCVLSYLCWTCSSGKRRDHAVPAREAFPAAAGQDVHFLRSPSISQHVLPLYCASHPCCSCWPRKSSLYARHWRPSATRPPLRSSSQTSCTGSRRSSSSTWHSRSARLSAGQSPGLQLPWWTLTSTCIFRK